MAITAKQGLPKRQAAAEGTKGKRINERVKEKRIKVCHVSSVHKNTDRRIFVAECSSLARAGYQTYLIGRGAARKQNGVTVIGIKRLPQNRIGRILHTAKAACQKALALDCDIYHLHDPELLPYALKLKKHGKKVIFDSHEFYTMQIPEKRYLPKPVMQMAGKLYGVYETFVLKRIDGVIFPCTVNGKNPFAGKCLHTAVVNNTPLLSELYEKYDPTVKKVKNSICCIGSLTHARGITNLVKAAYQAGCTLYLGGVFSSEPYQKAVERMPEYQCVEYLGYLDRGQVEQVLQKSMLCVSNTLAAGQYHQCDNLPTKVLECMSLGIPVVISKTPYVDRLLKEYPFGIAVDPYDIDETASGIRYILGHPKEAAKMGEAGRRAVREKMNWGVDEQALLSLYRQVIFGIAQV